MKNEINEMDARDIMSKALYLSRYEPERIEEYAKVFYAGAWRQIGRELARYNPAFLNKHAEHFEDAWFWICKKLAEYHPEYIESLKQHIPAKLL